MKGGRLLRGKLTAFILSEQQLDCAQPLAFLSEWAMNQPTLLPPPLAARS